MKHDSRTVTELERLVIGGLLVKPEAIFELPAGFSAQAFTIPPLAASFAAIDRLVKAKQPADLMLVAAEAKLDDRNVHRLGESIAAAEVGTPIRAFAEQLLDRSRRRTLAASLQAAAQALDGDADTAEVVGKLSASLLDLDASERPETVSYREALLSTLDAIDKVKSGAAKVLRTGFEKIDGILRIRPGNLIVLAARPKVGKSTLARQIARAVALRGEHVAWHGLEMDAPETIALDLSAGGSIDSMAFFDDAHGFGDREWSAITATADRLCPADGDGFIHANHYHHGLGAICQISEKLHRKHGLALIVVDYLQLVQCDLGRNATRENVVATIARTLKLLAMRLGVPVLALSQLNREVAKRGEQPKGRGRKDPMAIPGDDRGPTPKAPPPQLHDLRESGAIEQDANAVCFLHHPLDASPDRFEREHGPFDFIVAAQRLGPKGSVQLHAERNYSRFKEIGA